jgi:hypothetical protein
MFARSHLDLHGIRASVERTRSISDRVVGIGKFGIGLDGLLAWIPGVGAAYSFGAAAFLLIQGYRARASMPTLLTMTGVLFADTALDAIPIPFAPAVTDMLFTGHKWAATMLLKHIEETLYYEGTRHDAEADAHFRDAREKLKAVGDRRRIVFLHD